jgi:hypothetical protein
LSVMAMNTISLEGSNRLYLDARLNTWVGGWVGGWEGGGDYVTEE